MLSCILNLFNCDYNKKECKRSVSASTSQIDENQFTSLFVSPHYEQKKYGIIIGVNYNKSIIYNLQSIDNDIDNIYQLLLNNNFIKEDINILKNPTKNEIFDLFQKIISIVNINDYVFFYFSGHGLEDGLIIDLYEEDNETVIEENNLLFNFEIRNYLIDKLPKNVFLFGLIDSCDSENNFNLQYYYLNNKWEKNNKYSNLSACTPKLSSFDTQTNRNASEYVMLFSGAQAKENSCNVVIISAYMKNQVTYTKYINKKYESFFTNIFCDIISNNIGISWHDLIFRIKLTSILYNYKQTPIFSSSDMLNINDSIYL